MAVINHHVEEIKRATIRDGALILNFDTAENPLVARFDLDSLAQASFEIADKREDFYYITLRDFSGQQQDVARFGTKAEAHQALQSILQALLSERGHQKNDIVDKSCCKKGGCFLWRLIKWLAVSAGILLFLYLLLVFLAPDPRHGRNLSDQRVNGSLQQNPPSPLAAVPEGEAVDADRVLSPPPSTTAAQ